jgi:hypothetical protein
MFDSFASQSRFDFLGRWYDRISGRDQWIEADAQITGNRWQDDGEGAGGDYRVLYAYQALGERFSGSFSSPTPWRPGESLSVRHHPRRPKRHYLASLRSGREPLLFLGVAIACFLPWLFWHFFFL